MTRHIFLFLHRHSCPTPAATAIGSAPPHSHHHYAPSGTILLQWSRFLAQRHCVGAALVGRQCTLSCRNTHSYLFVGLARAMTMTFSAVSVVNAAAARMVMRWSVALRGFAAAWPAQRSSSYQRRVFSLLVHFFIFCVFCLFLFLFLLPLLFFVFIFVCCFYFFT